MCVRNRSYKYVIVCKRAKCIKFGLQITCVHAVYIKHNAGAFTGRCLETNRKSFSEKLVEQFLRNCVNLRKSENFPENYRPFPEKTQFYSAKIKFFILVKCKGINENSWKISGKFPKFRKCVKIFPGNFPEKFPENAGCFLIYMQWYRAKITFFIIIKVRTSMKNFGGNFREISEMSKIHGGNFSGKFPGNSGCFFRWNAMVQR